MLLSFKQSFQNLCTAVGTIAIILASSSISVGFATPVSNTSGASDLLIADRPDAVENSIENTIENLDEQSASRSRLWVARGQTLYELGRYMEALSAVDQALELQPDNSAAWELQGNILQKLERYEESLAAYDQALALLEDQPATDQSAEDLIIATLWAERARVLASLNRYEESVVSYDQALRLHCMQRVADDTSLPEICQDYVNDDLNDDLNNLDEPDSSTPVREDREYPLEPLW